MTIFINFISISDIIFQEAETDKKKARIWKATKTICQPPVQLMLFDSIDCEHFNNRFNHFRLALMDLLCASFTIENKNDINKIMLVETRSTTKLVTNAQHGKKSWSRRIAKGNYYFNDLLIRWGVVSNARPFALLL